MLQIGFGTGENQNESVCDLLFDRGVFPGLCAGTVHTDCFSAKISAIQREVFSLISEKV